MIQSVINELRDMPLREIGQASFRSKLLLLACSTMAVWFLADRLIFDPRQAWIMDQQQKISQWDQRIEEVKGQWHQQASAAQEYQSLISSPMGRSRAGSVETMAAEWLQWARQGLQAHHLNGDLEPSLALMNVSGLAGEIFATLSLDHQSVLIQVSGPWALLMHWWDALTDSSSSQIWIHEMMLKRGEDAHHVAMTAKISVAWPAASGAEERMRPMAVLKAPASIPYPLGLGRDHPMVWRQRPLDQLRLVGVALTGEQSWIWLMDPIGQMHMLGLGETIVQGRYQLEQVLPDQVVWRDLVSDQLMDWVVP